MLNRRVLRRLLNRRHKVVMHWNRMSNRLGRLRNVVWVGLRIPATIFWRMICIAVISGIKIWYMVTLVM